MIESNMKLSLQKRKSDAGCTNYLPTFYASVIKAGSRKSQPIRTEQPTDASRPKEAMLGI